MLENTVWEVITGLVQGPQKLESEFQSRLTTTGQDNSEQERKRLESELNRPDKAANRFLTPTVMKSSTVSIWKTSFTRTQVRKGD